MAGHALTACLKTRTANAFSGSGDDRCIGVDRAHELSLPDNPWLAGDKSLRLESTGRSPRTAPGPGLGDASDWMLVPYAGTTRIRFNGTRLRDLSPSGAPRQVERSEERRVGKEGR